MKVISDFLFGLVILLHKHSIEILPKQRVAILRPDHVKEFNSFLGDDDVNEFMKSNVIGMHKIGKNLKIIYTLKNLKL